MLAVPLTVATLLAIRRYYDRQHEDLAPVRPFVLDETEPPTVLVAIEGRTG